MAARPLSTRATAVGALGHQSSGEHPRRMSQVEIAYFLEGEIERTEVLFVASGSGVALVTAALLVTVPLLPLT